MFYSRVLSLLSVAAVAIGSSTSGEGCANVVYGKDGTEHCVDPCQMDQYVVSLSGVPMCPQNIDERPCPADCVAFDDDEVPHCTYTHDDDTIPCPAQFIHRGDDGMPECFDHCRNVRYFLNTPVCLNCDEEDIHFDEWVGPACFTGCKSVLYNSYGSPVCLHCSSQFVRYEEDGYPVCDSHASSSTSSTSLTEKRSRDSQKRNLYVDDEHEETRRQIPDVNKKDKEDEKKRSTKWSEPADKKHGSH